MTVPDIDRQGLCPALAIPAGARAVHLYGKTAAGRLALVDESDYDLVSKYRWNVTETRRPNGAIAGPYARSQQPGGLMIRMHTLITGYARTDHINRDGLDNRRENLRAATRAQNLVNSRKRQGGSSRFKGVHWHCGHKRWVSRIVVAGQARWLGNFKVEEDAARAYDAAAREAYGEFACLNFPAPVSVSSPALRGYCPRCGRTRYLAADGTLPPHMHVLGGDCAGSGQEPAR